jgi:hypothetical protein
MDDIKIILWIVIGLIYLFSRRKKAEKPPVRQPSRSDEQPAEEAMPIPKSFEELLREIEGSKIPAPAPRMERRLEPEPEVVDYDDNLGEERQEEPKRDYQKEDRIYQVYEEAKSQAFERPSLEETIKLEDTIVRFKQFKGYEKEVQKNEAHEFLQELRNPQGFRKAFVLSEILKRKF